MVQKIRVVYNELMSASNQFSQEGQEITQLYQSLKNATEELYGSGFVGRTSDSWYREMEGELLPAVMRLGKLLERSSSTVKTVHQNFHSAEDESAGLLKKVFGE
jgi:WXG100 family type VII secretion target